MHCILRVPQNTVDDYRNADVWCNFAVIVGEFGGVGDVDNNTVTVTINGGDIVATGGSYAAGIGSGCNSASYSSTNTTPNQTITINGGRGAIIQLLL